jgi:hypothetical protein
VWLRASLPAVEGVRPAARKNDSSTLELISRPRDELDKKSSFAAMAESAFHVERSLSLVKIALYRVTRDH